MSDLIAGLLQREERLKLVAISQMIRGLGSVAAFSLAFACTRNLSLAVVAMTAVWVSVLIFFDVRNVRTCIGAEESLFRLRPSKLKHLALLSLPLGWVATFQALSVNVPRYFLEHFLGLADQGIYASLAYLIVIINLIVFSLSQSATTRLSRMFADHQHEQFFALISKLSILGILVASLGAWLVHSVGRSVLALVYRPEYADHVGLLTLLVLAAGVNTIGAFLFCGITSARAFRAQVPVCIASLIEVTVASAILIPHWGLIGAGMAVMVSAVINTFGALWVIRGIFAQQSR